MLIHAGDFTRCGNLQEVREFNKWLATLPHKHKLVIAGNHELSFDPEIHKKMTTSTNQNEDHPGPGGPSPGACALDHGNISNPLSPRMVYGGRGGNDAHSAFSVSRSASSTKILDLKMGKMNLENAQEFIAETEKEFELGNFNAFTDVADGDTDNDDQLSAEDMKKELTNCIYLQDASVELYGLKFYGTPWQPEFGGWAFNLPRGQVRFFLDLDSRSISSYYSGRWLYKSRNLSLAYCTTKVLYYIIGEKVGKIWFRHKKSFAIKAIKLIYTHKYGQESLLVRKKMEDQFAKSSALGDVQ